MYLKIIRARQKKSKTDSERALRRRLASCLHSILFFALTAGIHARASAQVSPNYRTVVDCNGSDSLYLERHIVPPFNGQQSAPLTRKQILEYPVDMNLYAKLADGSIVSVDCGTPEAKETKMSELENKTAPYFSGPTGSDWWKRAEPSGIWKQIEFSKREITVLKVKEEGRYWKEVAIPNGYEVTTVGWLPEFEVKVSGTRQKADDGSGPTHVGKKDPFAELNKHMPGQRPFAPPTATSQPIKPADSAEQLGGPYCKIVFSATPRPPGANVFFREVVTVESIRRFTGAEDKVGVEIYNRTTPAPSTIRATPKPVGYLPELVSIHEREKEDAVSILADANARLKAWRDEKADSN